MKFIKKTESIEKPQKKIKFDLSYKCIIDIGAFLSILSRRVLNHLERGKFDFVY